VAAESETKNEPHLQTTSFVQFGLVPSLLCRKPRLRCRFLGKKEKPFEKKKSQKNAKKSRKCKKPMLH